MADSDLRRHRGLCAESLVQDRAVATVSRLNTIEVAGLWAILKRVQSRGSPNALYAASSGVPILESLDITAKTAGNVVVGEAILKVRTGIEQGQTFVCSVTSSQIFR